MGVQGVLIIKKMWIIAKKSGVTLACVWACRPLVRNSTPLSFSVAAGPFRIIGFYACQRS